MNPRQGVLISMFLGVAIYLLAKANPSVINKRVENLKQTPKPPNYSVPGGRGGSGSYG